MEQITREEMIELIDKASGLLCFYGEDKTSLELDEAIAALQEAEPVAWIRIRDCDCEECEGREQDVTTDPLWAKHYPDKWTPLFAPPPCPPAKALSEVLVTHILDLAAEECDGLASEWDSDDVVTDKNYAQACADRIRALDIPQDLLNPQPAKAQEDKELARAWFWKGAAAYKLKGFRTDNDAFAYFEDQWGSDEGIPPQSAKAQVPDERKAFEVWAEHEGLPVMPDGETYYNHQTHNAWVAWRSRALLTASPAPEHIEDKLGMVEALHEIAHSANRTATERQFSKYLQTIAADALAKVSDHAGEKTARQAVLDEAFEAVRKQLCRLPRYSFHAKYGGGIRRTEDEYGNWIEFDAVHALFDPVVVDAALTNASRGKQSDDSFTAAPRRRG